MARMLLATGLLLSAATVTAQTPYQPPFRTPSPGVLQKLRELMGQWEPDADGYYSPDSHGWVRRGKAVVLDGDTFQLGDTSIGLAGIDAPAPAQTCATDGGKSWPCGQAARARLAELINDEAVVCFGVRNRPDDQGRMLAACRVIPRPYLNGEMVGAGLALAHGRTSEQYQGREQAAREAGAGIWAGTFKAPWLWRGVPNRGK